MSTLLIGDATASYTHAIDYDVQDPMYNTYQVAFQFTALASGIVTSLRFLTNSVANTGLTGLRLAAYDDASDWPGALLDDGLASGEPATDSWITVSGLSIPVVLGTKYWLAALPLGAAGAVVNFNTALAHHASGGARMGDAPSTGGGTAATFLDPWPVFNGSTDDLFTEGPVGFQGLGDSSGAPAPPTRVEIGLTTLHRPAKTTLPTAAADHARVLAWASDYSDLLVTIPRNDSRTGEVSFSFDDPIVQHLYRDAHENVTNHEVQITTAFEVMLFVRYRGTPILWAPVVSMDFKMADRKVTINAVDVQRLIDHQIHVGDDAYPATVADRWVPATSDGVRTLIAAADMSADQLADGTPDHGIKPPAAGVGTTAGGTMQIATALDDPVWEKITELAGYENAVDFAVVPRDVENASAFPYYADVVCYTEQGTDRSDRVIFHAGFGRDNAELLDWSPGGPYMTHAVVRDADNKHRVVSANLDARRRTGAYVHMENLPSASPSGTMTARGDALIKQYSFPVDAHTLVIRDDPSELDSLGGTTFHFLEDFDLGDTITSEAQDGYYEKRVKGQINEFRLRQADGAIFKQELDLVPELVDVTDIGTEDP